MSFMGKWGIGKTGKKERKRAKEKKGPRIVRSSVRPNDKATREKEWEQARRTRKKREISKRSSLIL